MDRKPHKHLIVDMHVAKAPKDELHAKQLIVSLIENIKMKVATLSGDQKNPQAWYCDDPENRGLTAVGILTTSHTVFHSWDYDDGTGHLKFDLYSCSDFEPAYVMSVLDEEFEVLSGHYILLNRDAVGLKDLILGMGNFIK